MSDTDETTETGDGERPAHRVNLTKYFRPSLREPATAKPKTPEWRIRVARILAEECAIDYQRGLGLTEMIHKALLNAMDEEAMIARYFDFHPHSDHENPDTCRLGLP